MSKCVLHVFIHMYKTEIMALYPLCSIVVQDASDHAWGEYKYLVLVLKYSFSSTCT